MQPKHIVALALAVLLGSCATGPGPGSAGYPYNVRGAYTGRLTVDGRPFDGALSLRTSPGGRVTGTLRVVAPFRIDGSARGNLIDDLLRLTVTYRNDDGCDGRIEGILTVERGGGTIEGPVTLTDCREPVAGTFRFRRSG